MTWRASCRGQRSLSQVCASHLKPGNGPAQDVVVVAYMHRILPLAQHFADSHTTLWWLHVPHGCWHTAFCMRKNH
jgi:hypothetical protein